MAEHQRIKRRKPAAKRQIDWFPAPPPPPPLPEHLIPDVPVIDDEEEIIVPKVVEKTKEDPPSKDDLVFVPNLTLATREPHLMIAVEPFDWREKYERMGAPF